MAVHGRRLALRERDRLVRSQSGDTLCPVGMRRRGPIRTDLIRRDGAHRHPDVDGISLHTSEARRHNTDDREWFVVEGDCLSDDVPRSAERAAPEAVAQNRQPWALRWPILFRKESSAELWLHADRPEEVLRDDNPGNQLRVGSAAHGEKRRAIDSNLAER